MILINLGCGQTPVKDWRNFDNSISLRLAKLPLLPVLLWKLKLLELSQYQFISFAKSNKIEYGDATKGLPFQKESVDVIYSSHMIEHLDQSEAEIFLKEAHRLLLKGGIIRLVVPDIKKQVDEYLKSEDANAFIKGTMLAVPRLRTIMQRLRILFIGTRHHQWMYDGKSLGALLKKQGFVNIKVLPPGESAIKDSGSLDLHERASESIYVEAKKP